MNFLHLVFIKPIQLLLEWAFLTSYGLTGNYGIALVIMSLIITMVTMPLYYIAERWKRAEKAVQDNMAADLKSIKENYTGQKRYYLTQACYRLHGYNPLYSIRVSFGILIQVPFFLAAYGYLSHYTGYAGVSFLGIGDLGRPDTLLFGQALLPFVMTAVNLATSWMYSREKKFSDQLQLVLMALAFLILLYDRPAALLIYWTMNNVFGIFKTLVFMKIFPPLPQKEGEGENFRDWISRIIAGMGAGKIFLIMAGLYIFQSAWHDKQEATFEYLVPLFGLAAAAASLWALKKLMINRHRGGWRSNRVFIVIVILLWILQITAATFWVLRLNTTFISQNTMKRFIVILQDLIILASLLFLLPEERKVNRALERIPRQGAIFFAGLGFLGLFYFIASPLLIYASSPADVHATAGTLFARGLLSLAVLMLIGAAVFFLLKRNRRIIAVQGAVAAVLMLVFYYYILPSDYGVFNGLSLERYDIFYQQSIMYYFLDLIVLWGAIRLSEWILKGANRTILIVLILLSASLAGQAVYETVTIDRSLLTHRTAGEEDSLPADYKRIHSYSRDNTNIVYFVADMFVGGYIKDIVREHPDIGEALEGFVWYPNTLSVSYRTVTSMPSMFGGWDYTPEAFNNTPGLNRDKYEEAFRKLVDPLIGKGYDISVVNPQFFSPEGLYPGGEVVSDRSEEYRGYWESLHPDQKVDTTPRYNALFSMAAFMKAAPYSQRKFLYDDSGWILLSTSGKFANIWDKVLNQRPFLQLLPEIGNADSPVPAFKYFHSDFTHSPFGVDSDGNMVIDSFPDPGQNNFDYGKAAYYTALEFMRLFADYLSWLKEEGIYDNTIVVLVSDHGNDLTTDDPYIPDNLKDIGPKEFSRSHALLMVKKAGSRSGFAEDGRFMSNADVPAIISGVDDPTEGKPRERSLPYFHVWGNWNQYLDLEKGDYKSFQVHDTMFDGDNWEGE